MKPFAFLTAAVLVADAQSGDTGVITWLSTKLISEAFSSSITVRYGSSPVTPVPTSTAPIVIVSSYLSEPVASRNINHTSWATVIATEPLEQRWDVVYTTGTGPPPTVTVSGTATEVVWTSPTVATVTLTATTCVDLAGTPPPKRTITAYTGEYVPFPGQVTTTKTTFPTAVTTHLYLTVSYRVYTFTGSTATATSTATGTTFLSTTVVGTRTIDLAAVGKYYTRTRYRDTVTRTSSDFQLAYATTHVGVTCNTNNNTDTTITITQEAKCAPTNLISERDGRGVGIRLLPLEWTFPVGFPDTLIGIPGVGDGDPAACCQLCVDNEGCAASEWVAESWRGGCRLFYYVGGDDGNGNGNGNGNGSTCGSGVNGGGGGGGGGSGGGGGGGKGGGGLGKEGGLEYYADKWSLPGQGNYIQSGCGSLAYLGVMDPFCPPCSVEVTW